MNVNTSKHPVHPFMAIYLDGEFVGQLNAGRTVAMIHQRLSSSELGTISRELGVSIKVPVEPPEGFWDERD